MVALCVYYVTESLQQRCEVGFFNRYFSKEETLAQSDAGAHGHLASMQQRGSLNHRAHCFCQVDVATVGETSHLCFLLKKHVFSWADKMNTGFGHALAFLSRMSKPTVTTLELEECFEG